MADEPVPPEPAALLAATRFRDRLGGLLVGGFIVALVILFWTPIPEPNEQLITYMIGQLSGFAGGVVAYHYTMNALNVQATGNTGKMADAVVAAAKARTSRPADQPTGTEDDPTHAVIINEPHEPVPTTTEEAKP